jgi:hypothetical protein
VTGRADGRIRWTTIGCVALLALIAGTVSYLHMHMLVALHGQPGWVAALTPLSVDGMILAASTTLLADSRSGRQGGVLPWALLVAGSVASLAANVAVAEPSLIGRVIAAWPSFALTVSFELLTRQVRRGAAGRDAHHDRRRPLPAGPAPAERGSAPGLRAVGPSRVGRGSQLHWCPTAACPLGRVRAAMAGVSAPSSSCTPGWQGPWAQMTAGYGRGQGEVPLGEGPMPMISGHAADRS